MGGGGLLPGGGGADASLQTLQREEDALCGRWGEALVAAYLQSHPEVGGTPAFMGKIHGVEVAACL